MITQIPLEALLELQDLARQEAEVRRKCNEWELTYLKDAIDACDSWEEVQWVYGQIMLTDTNGDMLELPGLLQVSKAFVHDRFTYGDKASE